ncbi:hypothetical protein BHE74_00046784 [Ensete ventricosum]|nr:hypothetical protein BHE74_00046784 [Ensete ventricosum]
MQITPMDITNSERLHTKDNGPLQIEVSTSAYKTHSYLQAKIGHKANQNRAAKPTAGPLLAVQDLSRKAAAIVEEEKGSSDVGCNCAATSWLRVAWSQQGCGCNRRKTGQWYCSEKSLLVAFLPQRITAGCDQGGWQREITVGSVVQRGMRAAVEGIREVGSAEQNLHRRNDEFST